MNNYCKGCFEKQCKIDELTEEVKRLKARLNYLERQAKRAISVHPRLLLKFLSRATH